MSQKIRIKRRIFIPKPLAAARLAPVAVLSLLLYATAVQSADRYWVGGTGSWDQTSHWSTSSGGSSGASVPGSSDAAIFNGSSGTWTCTVNQTVSITRLAGDLTSMTVDFNDYSVTVSGGLDLYNGTFNAGNGTTTVGGDMNLTSSNFNGEGGTVVWNGTGTSSLRLRGPSTTADAFFTSQVLSPEQAQAGGRSCPAPLRSRSAGH